MTDPQKWAMKVIRDYPGITPSGLGAKMLYRPGIVQVHGPNKNVNAQGCGRLGGTMIARLEKKGWVRTTNLTRGQWHTTKAYLTPSGKETLDCQA